VGGWVHHHHETCKQEEDKKNDGKTMTEGTTTTKKSGYVVDFREEGNEGEGEKLENGRSLPIILLGDIVLERIGKKNHGSSFRSLLWTERER
jgi:hypothetical protein